LIVWVCKLSFFDFTLLLQLARKKISSIDNTQFVLIIF
jgi:hypothetical protein